MHVSALPCHRPDTDDRRPRRRGEPRRDGTGDHSVHFQGIGCWCRREDSNLHGVLNPTRSLAWRLSLFRSEPKHLDAAGVHSVHLSATESECPFRARVPSGCHARDS